MEKILVTGGAGFIGSNLCEHLVLNGYDVVCLDNFSTGHMSNIQHLIDSYPLNFKLIEGDIRNFETCVRAVNGVQYVLHEAALGSIPRSINDPITTNDVNIGGFLNMLVAARDSNIRRFIFAASSSTYGDNTDLPKKEDNIGKPLSPYALTKYVDELYADVFAKTYGIEYIGLRYFNVFGRRQDPEGAYAAVIPKFIKQLLANEQPTINGDGKQSRDFTYIENVIEANLKAFKANSKYAGEAFNIAYGGREFLIDVYHHLADALDKDIEPAFGSERAGDIKHSNADVSKAEDMLNYSPDYSFERGIREAIDWYNEKIN